ncbi:Fungal specific transcription factor domain-containing protein [Cladophialophora immunda]|nr:Fungal specific transcription factor domain-containing protein [Cladophialophora immunda]
MLVEVEQRSEPGISSHTVPTHQSNSTLSNNELVETEENVILQEEKGCMYLDPRGKYRYVDADSSLRFDHAALIARQPHLAETTTTKRDANVLRPFITTLMPPSPETVGSFRAVEDLDTVYLPNRETCLRYVTKFFEQVHAIYWVYSPEQFYMLLDQTLESGGSEASASWLCSLYSIFAICSMQPTVQEDREDVKSSEDYLRMAREYGNRAADEADIGSVKALVLMSLALNASFHSVIAYCTLGMTIRIAYSLGLHRNTAHKSLDSVEKERARRLWWTLYQLDQEVSNQLGHPFAIVDEAICIQTPFASEEILDPGRNTPLGYQAVCISLIKLKKKISQTLYVTPAQTTRRVRFQQVTSCIASLYEWHAQVPSHLRWGSSLAPSHLRAVSVLHLRYWITLVHVTRPFLLHSVTRSAELRNSVKKKRYDDFSSLCTEAAENAITILKARHEERNLSSLMLFDSGCIQELVQVFLLAEEKVGRGIYSANLEFCLKAMRAMEAVGWCKRILPDLETLLRNTITVDNVGDEGRESASPVNKTRDPITTTTTATRARPLQDYGFHGSGLFGDPAAFDAALNSFEDFELNIDPTQSDLLDTLSLDLGTFPSGDWNAFPL